MNALSRHSNVVLTHNGRLKRYPHGATANYAARSIHSSCSLHLYLAEVSATATATAVAAVGWFISRARPCLWASACPSSFRCKTRFAPPLLPAPRRSPRVDAADEMEYDGDATVATCQQKRARASDWGRARARQSIISFSSSSAVSLSLSSSDCRLIRLSAQSYSSRTTRSASAQKRARHSRSLAPLPQECQAASRAVPPPSPPQSSSPPPPPAASSKHSLAAATPANMVRSPVAGRQPAAYANAVDRSPHPPPSLPHSAVSAPEVLTVFSLRGGGGNGEARTAEATAQQQEQHGSGSRR